MQEKEIRNPYVLIGAAVLLTAAGVLALASGTIHPEVLWQNSDQISLNIQRIISNVSGVKP